jgi:hypothetical protein
MGTGVMTSPTRDRVQLAVESRRGCRGWLPSSAATPHLWSGSTAPHATTDQWAPERRPRWSRSAGARRPPDRRMSPPAGSRGPGRQRCERDRRNRRHKSAMGDANHRALLTHQGKYQARVKPVAVDSADEAGVVDIQPGSRREANRLKSDIARVGRPAGGEHCWLSTSHRRRRNWEIAARRLSSPLA